MSVPNANATYYSRPDTTYYVRSASPTPFYRPTPAGVSGDFYDRPVQAEKASSKSGLRRLVPDSESGFRKGLKTGATNILKGHWGKHMLLSFIPGTALAIIGLFTHFNPFLGLLPLAFCRGIHAMKGFVNPENFLNGKRIKH